MAQTQNKYPARATIASKLLIVFISFILIPMIFIGYVEYMYANGAIVDDQVSKLNAIANLKVEKIVTYFKQIDANMVLAQDFLIIKKNMPMLIAYAHDKSNPRYIAAKQELDSQLKPLQKINRYDNFMLLTTKGEFIYSSNPEHDLAYKSGLVKKMAEDVLTKPKTGIYRSSIFQYGKTARDSEIMAGSIVYDEYGNQIGILIAEVGMAHVYEAIQDTNGLGKTGETFIVEKRGNEAILLSPLRFDKNAAFTRTIDFGDMGDIASQDVASGQYGVIAKDYRDKQTLTVWRYIPFMNWSLVVKIDADEVFAKVYVFEELFWFLIAITLLIGIAVAFIIAKCIAGPICKLQRGAEIIGGGNLDFRVGIETRDEIGQLACSFDDMVANLKKKDEDLIIAKQKAEASSQSKSEFLAMMSHELRTPLNAIIGFSEILVDEGVGKLNEKQKEYVKDVLDSGQHLLLLINDVLDIKKVEAGKMELQLVETNIKSIVDSGILMIKEKADNHHIDIAENVDENIGCVTIDEVRMRQIMYNLLSNAVKFTPDGGKIGVEAKKIDNHEVLIAVWDTGVGIEEKDKSKIFVPFKQIDGELSRKYAGTGLGLTLVKKMVELQGGRIWFESAGKNQGSKFYFTLPTKQEVCHI